MRLCGRWVEVNGGCVLTWRAAWRASLGHHQQSRPDTRPRVAHNVTGLAEMARAPRARSRRRAPGAASAAPEVSPSPPERRLKPHGYARASTQGAAVGGGGYGPSDAPPFA